MANENKENIMEVSAPKEHKFGAHNLSDVVFIVGDERFHCHKTMLAARSDYFAAMFTSNFKEEDQFEVAIGANPRTFRWLMEILYNRQMTNYRFLWDCQSSWIDFPSEKEDTEECGCSDDEDCKHDIDTYCWLWREAGLLFYLAVRFGVLEIVRASIERDLLQCEDSCHSENCSYCATKLLISTRYKLGRYEEANVSNKEAVMKAITAMNKGGEKLEMTIALEDLLKLLART